MKCDKKFVFFLATHGCPKQFHVVKINTPQTTIKSAKAVCFQRFIHGCIRENEPEEREDLDSADDESVASASTALTLQDTQMTTGEGSS